MPSPSHSDKVEQHCVKCDDSLPSRYVRHFTQIMRPCVDVSRSALLISSGNETVEQFPGAYHQRARSWREPAAGAPRCAQSVSDYKSLSWRCSHLHENGYGQGTASKREDLKWKIHPHCFIVHRTSKVKVNTGTCFLPFTFDVLMLWLNMVHIGNVLQFRAWTEMVRWARFLQAFAREICNVWHCVLVKIQHLQHCVQSRFWNFELKIAEVNAHDLPVNSTTSASRVCRLRVPIVPPPFQTEKL